MAVIPYYGVRIKKTRGLEGGEEAKYAEDSDSINFLAAKL